jgi:1,4-alpha-glucan branching enzyme
MHRLGRALAEGFSYQGEASSYRDGEPRGEASAHLPPTAFVSFIQNHDQVGNNAFGSRLSHLASPEAVRLVAAIYLLSPEIPMLFMGEEWATERPFPFFCDFEPELAEKVREGRRREFARFPEFQDGAARELIPDPCTEATFLSAKLDWEAMDDPTHREWLAFYRALIALRRREIVPRLAGSPGGGGEYMVPGRDAVSVVWRLAGARLGLYANFGAVPLVLAAAPAGRLVYASAAFAEPTTMPARCVAFFLDGATSR